MRNSDSPIRGEGAELYVQAILMLEHGVITSRASRNMPGYDLIAHNLARKKDCKISVKYRKAANADGFRFTRLDDFDYFVGVIGRRGRVGTKASSDDAITDTLAECYVLTNSEVRKSVRNVGKHLLLPRNHPVLSKDTRNAWMRILHFLGK